MKFSKISLSLYLIFCLSFLATCKKRGAGPTGPDVDIGVEFSGQITLAGQPFADAVVYLSWGASQKTTTGVDGKFSFKNLISGNFIITPSRLGFAFDPSNYEVTQTKKDANFTAGIATYGTETNSIALDFTARDQNNNNVSLASFHSQVVLIDFTADWCVPCREKAETAEQFYQKYKEKGFIYILIVIEGNPSTWASTYGLTFPVLDDNSKAIYNLYRKTSIPLPHVLDRNLTIRYKKEGWNKSEVEEQISKFL